MQRIGHEMKAVQYYINNREPALADVMRYYNVTRGVAKTLFLISLHGGDFKHHLTSEYNFNMDDYSDVEPTLDRYIKDVNNAFSILKNHKDYAEKFSKLNSIASKSNKKGTFISWLCQDVESNILDTCLNFVRSWGYDPLSLIFDGFLMYWDKDLRYRNVDQLLRALEDEILCKTGFVMKFSSKPIALDDEDRETLLHGVSYKDTFDNTVKYNSETMKMVNTRTGRRPVIHPITNDKRVTIISAGMYNGKSRAIRDYLRKEFKKNKKLSVVSISMRIQHSRTLKGDYSKFDGDCACRDTRPNAAYLRFYILHHERFYCRSHALQCNDKTGAERKI